MVHIVVIYMQVSPFHRSAQTSYLNLVLSVDSASRLRRSHGPGNANCMDQDSISYDWTTSVLMVDTWCLRTAQVSSYDRSITSEWKSSIYRGVCWSMQPNCPSRRLHSSTSTSLSAPHRHRIPSVRLSCSKT